MIWDNLINDIKGLFIKPEKKEWLEKLVETLESKKNENISLPFKIADIKKKGFTVKVSGLYAFIAFSHMPWKYNDTESWIAVKPKLTNKTFFCKIHNISKNPLSIIINGEIPQFKKVDLEIGNEYKGLIIKKYNYGVLIDIGYNFDWKCGSLIGFLHKSHFKSRKSFLNCLLGNEIQIIYQSSDENERLVFSLDNEISNWNNKKPQELIGQVVLVQIIRKTVESQVLFLVNGKYKGKITTSKANYTTARRRKIKEALNNLKDGETINCKVIGCNEKCRVLDLKWIVEFDTHFGLKNTIENGLDYQTLQKLIALRTENEEVG
jgi:ribosomal protein S1